MNPALEAEFDRGVRVFPVLRVDWKSKGSDLRTDYVTPGGMVLPEVGVTAKALQGGWSPIQYGPGVRGSTLASTRAEVRVEDKDQKLAALLETFDPRRSAARISWGALDLVEADWEPIFVGLVEDWRAKDGAISIILKTDEADLRSPAPKPQFSRASWPSAPDPAIFGTSMPLVLGIHDSFRINVRGMVRATYVRIDDSSGTAPQFYSVSLGNLKSVDRVYFDGLLQSVPFQTLRGVYGGVFQTLITIDRDDAPDPDVSISVDVEGPDSSGGIAGATLVNPAAQLRSFLEEYVFRNNNDGIWVGAHPLIHQPSWSEVEAFFDAREAESAIVLGGTGSRPLGLDIVESFLRAYPFVRAWWDEQGQIRLKVLDYTDTDPDGALWFIADRDAEPQSFAFEPGDRKEVFNRVEMPYLFSDFDGKFLAQYEAHDVDSIEDPRARVTPNPWSQARFDQE